jgi:hypothetical protein
MKIISALKIRLKGKGESFKIEEVESLYSRLLTYWKNLINDIYE